jgi:hypothetical protein
MLINLPVVGLYVRRAIAKRAAQARWKMKTHYQSNSSVALLRLYSHHRNGYSHRAGNPDSHRWNTHGHKTAAAHTASGMDRCSRA